MESKDVASTKTPKTDIFKPVFLRSVLHIAESSSAVCIIPQNQGYQLSQKLCGVMLRGVLPTAESILKTSAQYPTLITSAHYPTLITSAQYPTLNISAHCPTLKGQCHEIFGPFLKKKKTLFSFC